MSTDTQAKTLDRLIPKHGPAWTLYAYALLAVAVCVGLVLGFLRAGGLH